MVPGGCAHLRCTISCAFGCGAFRNPPELVAQAFREVLQEEPYKHSFSKVVFAIKSNGRPDDNYNVFAQVLGEER